MATSLIEFVGEELRRGASLLQAIAADADIHATLVAAAGQLPRL